MICTVPEQLGGSANSLTPDTTDSDQLSRPESSSSREGHLPLAASPISGEVAKQEDFLTELLTSSENLGEHQQNHPTPVPGNSGIAGALRGIPIPFQLL